MRELQLKFDGRGQVKGFRFTQIKKSKYAYLYLVDTGNIDKQYNNETNNNNKGKMDDDIPF